MPLDYHHKKGMFPPSHSDKGSWGEQQDPSTHIPIQQSIQGIDHTFSLNSISDRGQFERDTPNLIKINTLFFIQFGSVLLNRYRYTDTISHIHFTKRIRQWKTELRFFILSRLDYISRWDEDSIALRPSFRRKLSTWHRELFSILPDIHFIIVYLHYLQL